ncbi:MAG: VCBS repeat-containing protein, partial [Verrucomicrobiota bacterium]
SVALADFDGDGLNDLLAGTTLYQGQFEDNRFYFVKTELLPERSASKLKTATFCDINGDGFPDILASFVDKGIEIYLNPAGQGDAFMDVTQSMGLDRPEAGAGSDAYVTPGDWNGDGLMDLFLAAGDGYLLIQDQDGRFTPKPHEIEFKFTVGADNETGITGAGVFMPIVQSEALDLVVPMEESWLVIANNDGLPEDITRWGNEISEGSNDHLSTIGADLNLDGYMDLFTVSRAPNGHNRFIINRGYGSFMLAPVHRHYEYVFRGPSSERGGLSSAVGDLNDDGAPDLVVGNIHGDITLIINDTLQARSPIEFPPREIKILEGTHLLQVRVLGTKGVTNARLRLIDKAGVVVARRDLGSNVAGGSFGPNRVSFAVRRPDVLTLEVRYSDGLIQQKEVDLTEDQYVSINIDRGEDLSQGVW